MTKTIATFSNGYVDVYKGTRPVRAAWMITDKETGAVLHSGHSLDVARAQKTAEGNCRYWNHDKAHAICGYYAEWYNPRMRASYAEKAKIRERNAAYRAAQRSTVNIEVIELN